MSWVQQQQQQQQPPQTTTSSTLVTSTLRQYAPGTIAPSPTTSSVLNSLSEHQHPIMHKQQLLGHFNNNDLNQPTRQHWQQRNPIMMHTTPADNPQWSHQQNVAASATTYQHTIPTPNNWQQPDLQQVQMPQQSQLPQSQKQDQPVVSNYASYARPPYNPTYAQQHQTHYQSEAAFANSNPPQKPETQQQNVQSFFDNANSKNDGWGDWDWNDSNNNSHEQSNINDREQQKQQLQQETQLEQSQQHTQKSEYNANVIENSFRSETGDNWEWHNAEKSQSNETGINQLPFVASNVVELPTKLPHSRGPLLSGQEVSGHQQFSDFAISTARPVSLPLKAVTHASTEVIEPANSSISSSTCIEALNENFNNAVAAAASSSSTGTNIPNSVYFSQAKPVSKPSRQYASPAAISPAVELAEAPTPQSQSQALHFDGSAELHQVTPSSIKMQADTPTTPTIPLQPPPPLPPPSVLPTPSFPPPVGCTASSTNPFKRTGAPQHHRSILLPSNIASTQALELPPPPADFANPICSEISDAIVPDNSEILHENQEVIANSASAGATQVLSFPASNAQTTTTHPPPNDERNQYLQTSHLSEHQDEEFNTEGDHFPPPGLSRLVLGEPELEASQRLVTGTEEVPTISLSNMNIDERHADGEDTSGEQPPIVAMNPTASVASNIVPINIDITADRNLYTVPGESNARNEQRVVTGVERLLEPATGGEIINEQREIELDGENLEDQQLQQQQPNFVVSRNEPPLEGAVSTSAVSTTPTAIVVANPLDVTHNSSNARDLSNISGNDDSDQAEKYQMYMSLKRKYEKRMVEKNLEKQRKEKQRSVDRYDSEDSEDEYRSDHDRNSRRNYREGSIRNDQEKERDLRDKTNRRETRRGGDFDSGEHARDKHQHQHQYTYSERRSQRYRYDADSKYETEESARHDAVIVNRKDRRSGRGEREHGRDRVDERSARSDRSEREYENYRRNHHHQSHNTSKRSIKRADVDGRGERCADEFADDEDRRRRAGGSGRRAADKDYRDDLNSTTDRRHRRSDKHRVGNSMEYEEYRKRSSRNTRGSDMDKERRSAHQAAMYGGYPPAAFGYDPYSYYYEQMARTNPQAYAEWYKKYYGQAADMVQTHDNLTVNLTAPTDGRESVHSGRSSTNYDKERYTKAYISQASEYHHHFMHQQQQQPLAPNFSHNINSITLERSAFAGPQSNPNCSYSLSGGLSTGSLSQTQHAASTAAAAATAVDYCAGASAANLENAYYARSNCTESRSANLSQHDVTESASADPQRLTPCKFVNDHAVVSFSAGLLVTVKPRYTPNGISNIVKLYRLGANDATRQLFQSFPGPLVRGLTHKKTIIEFCEEQIRLGPNNTTIYAKQILPINVSKYKASYTLMWNLLILLLRQNGMVIGTDIAELLLRNQEEFPYNLQSDSQNTTASNSVKTHSKSDNDSNGEEEENLQESDDDIEGDESVRRQIRGSTEESIQNGEDSAASTSKGNTNVSSCSSEEQVTAKFRSYLLYGNVNEALDWATENNLWGHALFLASKVDRRLHANVMMKFANKLSLNDPLQTLYQLMSGRSPSSVTCVQDEKWGDWRPHLSMILSNTSQKPELDRKAITTLGDSLFNRGDLFAAHFCYLMAQVCFGRYQESATQETTLQQNLPKLVLLGSSHYKSFTSFANNESIMMTEIYEYACSLNDEKFSLIEFQPYKYLLATRMLDYGYHLKSLMYMEQIATHIERNPSKFEPTFINKVFEFADRLKFYDPALEKTLDDSPKADGDFNNPSQNFEEQKWLQTLREMVTENKPNFENNQFMSSGTESVAGQRNYNDEFNEINKQFNELNMQYQRISSGTMDTSLYNSDNISQQMHVPNENMSQYADQQQQQQSVVTSPMEYNVSQQIQQTQPMFAADTQVQSHEMDTQGNYQTQYGITQPTNYYDPAQQQTGYNAPEVGSQNSGSYDYWGGQQQQQQNLSTTEETPRPTISMPNAKKSYDSNAGAEQNANQMKQQQQDVINSKKQRNDNKENSKSSHISSNQNSGWFGGIWNKLSLKPKNQMILPDDKNPTIVWDPEKKRWVNTEGVDDATEDSLKPPPKMSEIAPQHQLHTQEPQAHSQQQHLTATPVSPQFGQNQNVDLGHSLQQLQQQPQQQSQPLSNISYNTSNVATTVQTYSAIGANAGMVPSPTTPESVPTATPSLQSNMFKKQRNRTLKNSYVDVFNPSGAPMSKAAENVLAPALPPVAVPPGSFFIPGAPVAATASSGESAGYHQEQSQDTPQFYNPNQFGGSSY